MPKPQKPTSILIPTPEEDLAITAAAKDDPEALPLTERQLQAMVPLRSLRGRPKSANTKQLVSIRYSPEVLQYFKAAGTDWQVRMDEVLKKYVASQPLRDSEEG
jgi:uncharacterized protein (DUF4415 family)